MIAYAGVACAQPKRVVILYDERLDFPGLAALDASLVRSLNAGAAVPLEIYREQLDLSRFAGQSHEIETRDYLRTKYAAKPIDVVIAAMQPSLGFLLRHGQRIFPNVPIVFCGIDKRELPGTLPPHVTGVLVKREFRPTLDLALRLHPGTQRVVFVAGTSDFDKRLLEQASQEFQGLENRVDITYLTQLPMNDLRLRLANLPPRTLVLYSTIFRDGAGNSFIPHEAATRIAEAANAPVYAFVDQYIDRGVVGGYMYSIGAHAKAAARLALGILTGADVHSLPMVEGRVSSYIFDWRQLQRWRINESLLPPGSDIRYRRLSAWDQYRRHIVAALTLAILQAAIIAALIIERANRRQSQKRYALASSAGGVGVWDWDVANNAIYVDPFLKAVLGYRDREIGNDVDEWFRRIHADDMSLVAARTRSVIENQCASFEVEHRMLHRDGSIRWFLCRGSATRRNGRVLQITGTDTDITARKESEQLLGRTQEELTRVSRITALGEFAASVTHEIRQPLTAITLNVEACLAHLKDTAPRRGQMRAALRDALRATKQADDLMNRNRELFRFRTVQKEFVDINAVIENVTLVARPRLNSAQVSLVTALAPDLPQVPADRIELEHVLLNLIANAIDATQYQTSNSRRIQITSSLWEDQIEVAVRDNGVGLGSVELDKLFTLSYTTKPTGTGIGLSLCRSILEAHGGCIWAEQNPGPGASFYLTLPADTKTLSIDTSVAKPLAHHLVESSQLS